MNKVVSVRRAITDAVPELHDNPDKLLVFVDAGKVIATSEPALSFEYRYTVNAIITDFAGDADAVFVALIAWVKRHQSDLFANADERMNAISFEVDHLTQTTCDLSIKLNLTESVVVGTDAAGTQTIEHVDEHVPEWNLDSLIV
jgi:hypothetical protein